MVGKGEARRDTGLRQRVENDRPMIDIEAPLSVDMRSDGLRHLAVLRRKQCVGLQPSLVKADVVERQIENVGQHGVTRYVTTHRIAKIGRASCRERVCQYV